MAWLLPNLCRGAAFEFVEHAADAAEEVGEPLEFLTELEGELYVHVAVDKVAAVNVEVDEVLSFNFEGFIADSDGYGIPRCFDCDEDEMITDPKELNHMDDEQLLEVFEAVVGFGG